MSRPDDYRPEGVLTNEVARKMIELQHTKVYDVPENITTLDVFCFHGTGVKEVHLHENVLSIGCCAF